MSTDLILITGVSGHVGFRTLVETLCRNYRVRAVIRKEQQQEKIRNAESVKPFVANLEFVVVEDLLKDGAFDNVLDGVNGVLHIASPMAIATDNYKRDIIDPAIDATVGILKSAAKVPSVRRVVITSSVAALVSMEYILSDDYTKVFTAKDVVSPPTNITDFPGPVDAYAVSKILALAASESFVKDEKPQFDIVSIMPSMVIGRNELNTKKEELEIGTNVCALGPLIGRKAEWPTIGTSVHLHDVARAHVDALNPAIPGNTRLLCSSGGHQGTTWDDAKEIVKRLYPKQVSEGTFPLTGTNPSRPVRFDVSEAEELLGWKFAGYEEQVKSLADHYVELASA